MSEEELTSVKKQNYAVNNRISPFDKVFKNNKITKIAHKNRITYLTKTGKTKLITLNKSNKYHNIIFKAFNYGFQSDWFERLGDYSKSNYFDTIRILFDWLNDYDHGTNSKTRYKILKEYEEYRLNDKGLKTNPLNTINKLINEGMASTLLATSDYEYLQTLLSVSKPVTVYRSELEHCTLSSWFNLPWLRSVIGEPAYLQLESPRLLFISFRVTIASTLLFIMNQKAKWQHSTLLEYDTSNKSWQYTWNRIILTRDGIFNEDGEPSNELSELLLLDMVRPSKVTDIKNRIAKFGNYNHTKYLSYPKTNPWQKPVLFHPSYQKQHSALEELLCGWLIACEAIQPSDIPKLKKGNYACEYNRANRLTLMQCTYYKGRSGVSKQPAILMGNDLWTQALHQYIKGCSSNLLFKTKIATERRVRHFDRNSELGLLFKIWKMGSFQKTLNSNLKKNNTNQLFLQAILALEQGGEDSSQFIHRTGKTTADYRAMVSMPLPVGMLTMSHIKNTAVHAGTDRYRESDLINHHSHSSITEKHSYLTDANKDWVNQAGRITRLVLHDLQNIVYRPSISPIIEAVQDLTLRTKIIRATGTKDISIQSLRNIPIDDNNHNAMVVLDTLDTALYFIHYLTEAEALLPQLLSTRPDWVEQTLIVQVEWMTRTLMRLSTAAAGQKAYPKLKAHLPPLFEYLLETIE